MLISFFVYLICECFDRCKHDKETRSERMTDAGQHYGIQQQLLGRQGSAPAETVNVLNSLSADHRAYKLCFALLNMCSLPLSFATFSGLQFASNEFQFIGDQASGVTLSGRFLLNSPTINASSAAAARMNIASAGFLIIYVLLIPTALYRYIYRSLVNNHTAQDTGLMNRQSPLVLICGSYFGAYRSSNKDIIESGIIDEPAESAEMARTRTTRAGYNSRGCACCAHNPGEYRWWPLFVVLPRRVLFTLVVAFFPPNSPLLPLLIFMLLLAALLLQFRYQPMRNRLDNVLESFTLATLLVSCIALPTYLMLTNSLRSLCSSADVLHARPDSVS